MIKVINNYPIKKEQLTNKLWRTLQATSYDCNGTTIRVPAGFQTDGASVGLRIHPETNKFVKIVFGIITWFLQLFFPRWHKKYEHAVLLHDYLYRGQDKNARIRIAMADDAYAVDLSDEFIKTQRKAADKVMLELSSGWRRKPMYYAVRLAGMKAWRK